jgi:TRAP transporter TAXI family solute receptor
MITRATPPILPRVRPVVAALITILIAIAAVLSAPARASAEVFASVGTGELNGVYYPVGKAICQIVNGDLSMHGVRCSPEATPGSVYNISAIQSGELEFGIVQSDVQFAAYKGEGAWIGRPFTALRSVVSLYPELVTVITRADSHIQDLAGLAGRRVKCGQPRYRYSGDLGRYRSGTRLARRGARAASGDESRRDHVGAL